MGCRYPGSGSSWGSVRAGWGCPSRTQPVSAGSSQIQPPTTGHGWAPRTGWVWHGGKHLRNGKITRWHQGAVGGNGRNNFGNTKVGEEGTGEGGPCAGAEVALQPVETPWWRRCFPAACGRTHTEAGEKCEGEAAVEQRHYGLTTVLIPHPPLPRGVGEVEDLAMEWSWALQGKRKKVGWRRCLTLFLIVQIVFTWQ